MNFLTRDKTSRSGPQIRITRSRLAFRNLYEIWLFSQKQPFLDKINQTRNFRELTSDFDSSTNICFGKLLSIQFDEYTWLCEFSSACKHTSAKTHISSMWPSLKAKQNRRPLIENFFREIEKSQYSLLLSSFAYVHTQSKGSAHCIGWQHN